MIIADEVTRLSLDRQNVPRDTAIPRIDPEAQSPACVAGTDTGCASVSPLQPVSDVPSYLAAREKSHTRHLHFTQEESLFTTLPLEIKSQLRALLGSHPGSHTAAFYTVQSFLKAGLSVHKACEKTLAFRPSLSLPLKTFRAKYDAWAKAKDWLVLVNRSKAGPDWQEGSARGLPAAFITFCASRIGEYKREDGQRQALFSIHRHWKTGLNNRGLAEPIPGYEKGWASRNPELLPEGWHETNIRRQIKKRGALPKAVAGLLTQGTAAAIAHIPQVRSTRQLLRFMEHIQFDDVKTDWRVLVDGAVCDLWLLVARDLATTVLLGFGLRPARVREDGSQEHLKLQDMKQLLGWLFEHYGLPPYTCHHKYERGTASISAGTAAAIHELFGDLVPSPGGEGQGEGGSRIVCHFSGMLGGASPAGYAERKVGNARGKASLESHNRLMHTIGADLPGQTGPSYGKRPADLAAREKEAVEIWQLAQHLPEHLRGNLAFPILTLGQARAELRRIFTIQNTRTVHETEGFEDVVEAYLPSLAKWVPANFIQHPESGIQHRVRKESPCERAGRLRAPYAREWSAVSPEIITAFYQHTQRPVKIETSGEIQFTLEGRRLYFVPPPSLPLLPSVKSLLGYCNPDDPKFLHLTNGVGSILGTWLRRDLVSNESELQAAIRYSAAALAAVKQTAADLNAPERERLDAMRQHNAELLAANTFVEIAEVPGKDAFHSVPIIQSPVASALTEGVQQTRAQLKADKKQRATEAEDARANLMSSML